MSIAPEAAAGVGASPCLRVRVGRQAYLVPTTILGRIGGEARSEGARRLLDARRLLPDAYPRSVPVALEWQSVPGRVAGIVLVDEVQGFVTPETGELVPLPRVEPRLATLFDAAWYDRAEQSFALRVRAAPSRVPGAGRRLALALQALASRQGVSS